MLSEDLLSPLPGVVGASQTVQRKFLMGMQAVVKFYK